VADALPALSILTASHPDGVLLVDVDARVLFQSHAGLPSPGETSAHGFAPDSALRMREAVATAFSSAEPTRLDVRALDGRVLRAVVSPVRAGGATVAALVALADITEHVNAEERLRRSEALLTDAQGTAHMGTWEWDVSQPHAWWSDELYSIYGLTSATYAPSYEGYLKMVHPEDRQRVIDATNGVFHQHVPYSHDERIFRPDGSIRHLHTWARPVLDANGKLSRLVGVCQDVTEQKLAEGAMRTQTISRSLVRRLVLDMVQKARVSESVLRELGRGLAGDQDLGANPISYVEAFREMGLGDLRLVSGAGGRYRFAGSDLLERQEDASLPTCALALGYLEGVVRRLDGRVALGTELKCQSTGAHECEFVVRT
jgi:PAS domain S-box-containing protein